MVIELFITNIMVLFVLVLVFNRFYNFINLDHRFYKQVFFFNFDFGYNNSIVFVLH